jgi:hypothetical protein
LQVLMNAGGRSVTKQTVMKTHAQRKHAQCPALRLAVPRGWTGCCWGGGGHQKLQVNWAKSPKTPLGVLPALQVLAECVFFEGFFGCYESYDPVSKSRQ